MHALVVFFEKESRNAHVDSNFVGRLEHALARVERNAHQHARRFAKVFLILVAVRAPNQHARTHAQRTHDAHAKKTLSATHLHVGQVFSQQGHLLLKGNDARLRAPVRNAVKISFKRRLRTTKRRNDETSSPAEWRARWWLSACALRAAALAGPAQTAATHCATQRAACSRSPLRTAVQRTRFCSDAQTHIDVQINTHIIQLHESKQRREQHRTFGHKRDQVGRARLLHGHMQLLQRSLGTHINYCNAKEKKNYFVRQQSNFVF